MPLKKESLILINIFERLHSIIAQERERGSKQFFAINFKFILPANIYRFLAVNESAHIGDLKLLLCLPKVKA